MSRSVRRAARAISHGRDGVSVVLDELPELTPLREVADVLAEHEKWPPLYDIARPGASIVPIHGYPPCLSGTFSGFKSAYSVPSAKPTCATSFTP
jgi:hypothetical protein